ncbi:MAG: hypothetical protein KJ645_04850 [Planctomycetes bacterium]|nr:hypothetical protein [Planctomycetota bacterium]
MSKNFLIGIDEAGLGPRLGPLVVSLVCVESLKNPQSISLYKVMSDAISLTAPLESPQVRLGDSKIIYRGARDFAHLEKTALSFWYASHGEIPGTLANWLNKLCGSAQPDFSNCPWYGPNPGTFSMPCDLTDDMVIGSGHQLMTQLAKGGIDCLSIKQRVVTAPDLNRKIDRLGLKSEALIEILFSMIKELLDEKDPGVFIIDIDKLGGRNYYEPVLVRLFPSTSIQIKRENPGHSTYQLIWQDKRIKIRFLRRGDQLKAQIALASIYSKYTREVCMRLFNRFWNLKKPGLKPTAGYPQDAARFLEEILPTARQAGLNPEEFTRKK